MLRRAVYVLPAASIAMTAAVLLGPGRARPAFGARAWGAMRSGESAAALRLEIVSSAYGVEDAARDMPIVVVAKNGALELGRADARSGPDGVAEVAVPTNAAAAIDVTVRGERGEELLDARLDMSNAGGASSRDGYLRGRREGPLALRVLATRGVLAAPFTSELRVSIEGACTPANIRATASGADVTPELQSLDADRVATFSITPRWHDVELSIEAKTPDGVKSTWVGLLPVVPGAQWLAPESSLRGGKANLVVVSPAPRERAYVSLWDEDARVAGAIVPLARDDAGFFRGAASVDVPNRSRLFAVVAGDAHEKGSGTVAYPLAPPEGSVEAPRVKLLADGVPAAVAAEERRASAARRSAVYVVVASGALEVLLLMFGAQRAQRTLEEHLKRELDPREVDPESRARVLASARERPWLRAALAAALVALAFAVTIAIASFR